MHEFTLADYNQGYEDALRDNKVEEIRSILRDALEALRGAEPTWYSIVGLCLACEAPRDNPHTNDCPMQPFAKVLAAAKEAGIEVGE